MRLKPLVVVATLGATAAGAAWAVDRYDYIITSNKVGAGADGLRLALGLDTAPTPDEPCHLTTASNPTVSMVWTDQGTALGISLNRSFDSTYDYVYASVSEANTYNGCSAATGWCLGTAWYDVSDTDGSPSITWSWDPQVNVASEPVVPDVAAVKTATIDTAVLLNKEADGDVFQHVTSSPTTNESYTLLDELSQVRWAGTGYFVATVAGSTTGSVDGSVILGKRLDTSTTPMDTVVVDGPSGSKPEGIDVVALNSGNRGHCNSDAEYLVYVTDYENSRLYLYWVDTDTGEQSINEQVIYRFSGGTNQNWISLDTDEDSVWSSVDATDECNPSSVRFHNTDHDVFVTCQNRDSIIRVDTAADLCDPSWYVGTSNEVRLKKYSSGGTPSCTNEATLTDCGGASDCQPHTIEYDYYIRGGDEWLYVGLTEAGQILAVQQSNLSNQRLIFKQSPATYKPLDFVVVPSCNPNDPNCVYP